MYHFIYYLPPPIVPMSFKSCRRCKYLRNICFPILNSIKIQPLGQYGNHTCLPSSCSQIFLFFLHSIFSSFSHSLSSLSCPHITGILILSPHFTHTPKQTDLAIVRYRYRFKDKYKQYPQAATQKRSLPCSYRSKVAPGDQK